MKIKPLLIKQKQFRVRFRGFDRYEVDAFLEQIADTYSLLQQENENIQKELNSLKYERQGYKEREETFKRAMLNSQKVLEQMKENARKSAELIIADAEVKAEKILSKAHNRLAQLNEDIIELKRQRVQIEIQIRSIIESHTKLLDIEKEETNILDNGGYKIKLLNN